MFLRLLPPPSAPRLARNLCSAICTQGVRRGVFLHGVNQMRIAAFVLHAALAASIGCHREPKALWRAEAVTRGAISEIVSATGEVSAVVTVSVGSQISGTISRLAADWNTPVKAGQVVAELDPRLFEVAHARALAGLKAAHADLERARVALADCERAARRTGELLGSGLVSRAELDAAISARDAATAALKGADARVVQAEADRDAALTNLALCRIRSPIDGVVISRNVDVGQTVAASLQSPTLFVIANDLSRMQVLANVDEADVGKVKEGLVAHFSVDAFPGEVFRGRIREVRQAPTSIQGVVTYAAVVDAPNPQRKLRQGMTASISIVTNQRAEVLRIPNGALRYRPPEVKGTHPGGAVVANAWADEAPSAAEASDGPRPGVRKATAWKLDPQGPVRVQLLTGISNASFTEVISGLSEGDRVIVADGGAVRPQGGKHGPF